MVPVKTNSNWLPSIFNDFFENEWLAKTGVTAPAINVIENDKDYKVETRTIAANAFQLFDFNCESVKKHTLNSVCCALDNLVFNLTAYNRRNTLNCP